MSRFGGLLLERFLSLDHWTFVRTELFNRFSRTAGQMRETDLFGRVGFVAGKYLWLNKKLPDGPNDQTRAYDGPHGGYVTRQGFGDKVPIELQDDKYLGHQNS